MVGIASKSMRRRRRGSKPEAWPGRFTAGGSPPIRRPRRARRASRPSTRRRCAANRSTGFGSRARLACARAGSLAAWWRGAVGGDALVGGVDDVDGAGVADVGAEAGVVGRGGLLAKATRMSRARRARSKSRPSCLRLSSFADGCRSGCRSRACRRNASRISSTPAPRVTPRASRASSRVMRHPRGIAGTRAPVAQLGRVPHRASRGSSVRRSSDAAAPDGRRGTRGPLRRRASRRVGAREA